MMKNYVLLVQAQYYVLRMTISDYESVAAFIYVQIRTSETSGWSDVIRSTIPNLNNGTVVTKAVINQSNVHPADEDRAVKICKMKERTIRKEHHMYVSCLIL